ncbi:MAG: hypothetical protein J5644_04995 [Bacteroidales bacterium]|nr:hypothetical protein [Bacteroidales bacterium]
MQLPETMQITKRFVGFGIFHKGRELCKKVGKNSEKGVWGSVEKGKIWKIFHQKMTKLNQK